MKEVRGQRVWSALNEPFSSHHRHKELKGTTKEVTVCNVHPNSTKRQLYDICCKYGSVHDVRIDSDRGIAWVTMDTESCAATVFVNVHRHKLHSLSLITAFDIKSSTLCLEQIPRCSETDIYDLIQSGCTADPQSIIIREKKAFIEFKEDADVTLSAWKLNGMRFQNADVEMESVKAFAVKRGSKKNRVERWRETEWVKICNVPLEVTEQDLLDLIRLRGGNGKRPPRRILILRHSAYRDNFLSLILIQFPSMVYPCFACKCLCLVRITLC